MCKRLDSTYEPGRRSGARLKHKLRRREIFDVCGWTAAPAGYREADRIYVARQGAAGSLQPAGVVELGLGREEHMWLRAELTARQLSTAVRHRFIPVAAGVQLEIDFHGSPNRPLRDPLIKKVLLEGRSQPANGVDERRQSPSRT